MLAKQQAVPEGWQLVPVEPTIEMVQAATHDYVGFGTRAEYQAMLAAAPVEADDVLSWIESQIAVLEPNLPNSSHPWGVDDHERQARYNVWCVVRDRIKKVEAERTAATQTREPTRIKTNG